MQELCRDCVVWSFVHNTKKPMLEINWCIWGIRVVQVEAEHEEQVLCVLFEFVLRCEEETMGSVTHRQNISALSNNLKYETCKNNRR